MALLQIEHLSVVRAGRVAVREVSFKVEPGEIVALLGANGAGKSSLLAAIMGLAPATVDRMCLENQDIDKWSAQRRARAGLGYAPEGRRVFPGLTVRENLEMAAWAPGAERRRRLDATFARFPQLRAQATTRAWQLSGGQQAMLAIGRALMAKPRVLLMDEPSLGLAPKLIAELFAGFRAITADGTADGTAIVIAEQNARAALAVADRALVLEEGTVAQTNNSTAMLDDPNLKGYFLGG